MFTSSEYEKFGVQAYRSTGAENACLCFPCLALCSAWYEQGRGRAGGRQAYAPLRDFWKGSKLNAPKLKAFKTCCIYAMSESILMRGRRCFELTVSV
jgi:hypothetical protein